MNVRFPDGSVMYMDVAPVYSYGCLDTIYVITKIFLATVFFPVTLGCLAAYGYKGVHDWVWGVPVNPEEWIVSVQIGSCKETFKFTQDDLNELGEKMGKAIEDFRISTLLPAPLSWVCAMFE